MNSHALDVVSSALSQTRLSGINSMMESIGKAFKARACVLWELTPDSSQSKSPQSEFLFGLAHWPEETRVPFFRTPGNFVTAEVARTQHEAAVLDVSDDPRVLKTPFLESFQVKAMCAVPVRFLDGNRGALSVYRDKLESPFPSQEVQDLKEIARLIPSLYQTIRDKVSFTLLQKVNKILYDSERGATQTPLSLEQVKTVLEKIGRDVADTLQCLDASIILGDRLEKESTVEQSKQYQAEPITFDLLTTTLPSNLGDRKRSYRKDEEGPTAQVLTRKRSLQVFNLRDDDWATLALPCSTQQASRENDVQIQQEIRKFHNFDQDPPPVSFIAAPILSGSRIFGVFCCRARTSAPYYLTQRDLALLELIAGQIGLYWANWLNRREMGEEKFSLQALVDGIGFMNGSVLTQFTKGQPDEERLYQQTLDVVSRVVKGEQVSDIRMFNEAERTLSFVAFRGKKWDEGAPEEIRRRKEKTFDVDRQPPQSAGAHVYQTRNVWEVPDVTGNAPYDPTFCEARHVIVAPIQVGEKFYGVLDVRGMEAHSFPKHIRTIIEVLGEQLGLYIYLAESRRRLAGSEAILQEMAREQRQIFEDLKHQLRSPLIQANVRLSSISIDQLDPKNQTLVFAGRGLARKTLRVATNIGLFASLAAGEPLQTKPTMLSYDDLYKLLVEAAKDHEVVVDPSRDIKFVVERHTLQVLRSIQVKVDRDLLEQALNNLLDNAAKYSYPSTTVRLSGGTTGTGRFYLSVLNKGIPIEREEVKLCRRRGWRGEMAQMVTGEGGGIGLWIVDNIMESHKGNLVIYPEKGNLTEARLIFPPAK